MTERTLTVDDLEEGSKYQFRVSAENAAGVGQPCEPIDVLAKDPFGTCARLVFICLVQKKHAFVFDILSYYFVCCDDCSRLGGCNGECK